MSINLLQGSVDGPLASICRQRVFRVLQVLNELRLISAYNPKGIYGETISVPELRVKHLTVQHTCQQSFQWQRRLQCAQQLLAAELGACMNAKLLIT